MPFIKMALDAKEPVIAPEAEYDLRIFKVEDKKTGPNSKTPGEPMLLVMINIEEPGAGPFAPIFHNLMLVTKNTPEKNVELYKLGVQRFLACFNITGDAEGFDTDDFQGSTGRCLVTQEDGEQGPRNVLKLPRLDDEPDEAPKKASRGRRGALANAE